MGEDEESIERLRRRIKSLHEEDDGADEDGREDNGNEMRKEEKESVMQMIFGSRRRQEGESVSLHLPPSHLLYRAFFIFSSLYNYTVS